MKFKKALAVTLAATTVLTSANVTGLITPVEVEAAATDALSAGYSTTCTSITVSTGCANSDVFAVSTSGTESTFTTSVAATGTTVTINKTVANANLTAATKYYLYKQTSGTGDFACVGYITTLGTVSTDIAVSTCTKITIKKEALTAGDTFAVGTTDVEPTWANVSTKVDVTSTTADVQITGLEKNTKYYLYKKASDNTVTALGEITTPDTAANPADVMTIEGATGTSYSDEMVMKYTDASQKVKFTSALTDLDDGWNSPTISYTVHVSGEAGDEVVTGLTDTSALLNGGPGSGSTAGVELYKLLGKTSADEVTSSYVGKTITITAIASYASPSAKTSEGTMTIRIAGSQTQNGDYEVIVKGKNEIKVQDKITLTGIINKVNENVTSKGATKYTWSRLSGTSVDFVDANAIHDKELKVEAKSVGISTIRLTAQQVYEDADGYTQISTTTYDYEINVSKADLTSSMIDSAKIQTIYIPSGSDDVTVNNALAANSNAATTVQGGLTWTGYKGGTTKLTTASTKARLVTSVTKSTVDAGSAAWANYTIASAVDKTAVTGISSVDDIDASGLDDNKWYKFTVGVNQTYVMFRTENVKVEKYAPYVTGVKLDADTTTNWGTLTTSLATLVKGHSTQGETSIQMQITLDSQAYNYYKDNGGKYVPNITFVKTGAAKDAVEIYDVKPGTLASDGTMVVTAKVKAVAEYKNADGNDITIKAVVDNGNKYTSGHIYYDGDIKKAVKKADIKLNSDTTTTREAAYDADKTLAQQFASLIPSDTDYVKYTATYTDVNTDGSTSAAGTYTMTVTGQLVADKAVWDGVTPGSENVKTYTVKINETKLTNADIAAVVNSLGLKSSYAYGTSESTVFAKFATSSVDPTVIVYKKNGVKLTLQKYVSSSWGNYVTLGTGIITSDAKGTYRVVASADDNYVLPDDVKENYAADFTLSKVEGVGTLKEETSNLTSIQVAKGGHASNNLVADVTYGKNGASAYSDLSISSCKWYRDGQVISSTTSYSDLSASSATKGTYKCELTFTANAHMTNGVTDNKMTVVTNEVKVIESDITVSATSSAAIPYAEGGKTGNITINAGSGLKNYTATLEDKDGNVVSTKTATYTDAQLSTKIQLDVKKETKAGAYKIHVVATSVDGYTYDSAYDSVANVGVTITPYDFAAISADDFVVENVVYGGNEKDAVVKFKSSNETKNKYWDQIVKSVVVTTDDDATTTGSAELGIKVTFKDAADIPNFNLTSAGNVDQDADGKYTDTLTYEVVQKPVTLGIKADATYDVADTFDSATYVTSEGFIADDLTKLDVVYYADIVDADGKVVDATSLKKGEYKLVAHVEDEKFFDNYTFVNGTGTLKVTDEKGDALTDAKNAQTKAEADKLAADKAATAAKADATAANAAAAGAKDAQTKAEADAQAQKDAATAAAQKQAEAEKAAEDAAEAQKKAEADAAAQKAAADKAAADAAAAQKAQKEAEAKAATAAATAQATVDASTAVGAEAVVSKTTVKVTAADAVQITGATSSKVTIGKTVTINGKTFTVASIAKNAFKGSAATVTIKNTSVKIAKTAFKNFKGKVVLSKKLSTKAKKAMVKKLTAAGVKKSQISYK